MGIKIGSKCLYHYDKCCSDGRNKSHCIVEVVEYFRDDLYRVRFLQVIVDDSGNNYFTYLMNNGKTMMVSEKYLDKLGED